jgi:hypothetical protein
MAATHLTNRPERISQWATSWFVKCNPTKSESLTVTLKRQQVLPADVTFKSQTPGGSNPKAWKMV